MENKAWLWRKRSSEKTIVVNDKVNPPLVDGQEEKLVNDNTLELERSVRNLNDKLFSALSECNAKSELATKHAKMADEALAGWEKAEAEAMSLKEELDEALRQKAAKEERISHLDAALKECMQQLRFVREDKEQRIHDVVTKTAKESEKIRMVLEEKLSEASKRLAKLNAENNHLSKVLNAKEKLVEDFNKRNSQAESDFNALMSRLDSTEKKNTSLQYELCMLEKELEIRHEEKEFNRRLADASQKQHLESLKKISRLEAECQKLRLLVRKRLPGPAALAKMKTEVEMLGRESTEMRRRSSSPLKVSMVKSYGHDSSLDSPSKRTTYLMDRLCAMEEENKTLKESLSKKNDELQSFRIMSTHIASKNELQSPRNAPVSHGFSLASIGEANRNEDAESWDSTPISELEHFKNEKPRGSPSCKSVGVSDISLMDDFVEMEKLAIVSVDKSFGSSHVSEESITSMRRLEYELGLYPSKGNGKELVPVGFTDKNHGLLEKDLSAHKYPGWLEEILSMILEQNRVTQKSLDEILRDIITALGMGYSNNPALGEVIDAKKNSSPSCPSGSPQISGYISCRSPNSSPVVDSFDHASDVNISLKQESTQQSQSSLSKSLCKLVELIEGIINQPSVEENSSQHSFAGNDGSSVPYSNIATPAGYMVRVFQWKSSELIDVLQQFSHTCNDLLNGKTDVEQFARELTSSFDWIMNHCFSLQDVSSMRDTIKKHFDWDESQSEYEVGVGMNSLFSEADSDRNLIPHLEEKQSSLREENKMLKDELERMESENKDLEGRVQSATDKIEGLMIQLQESENSVANLQKELETLKESKEKIEDQIENYKLLDEDLNTQLTVTRGELNEARQKFSSLEVELDDRSNCCRELEATCLELQLQLESVTKKEPMQYGTDQEERQHQTDWKITAASEKLAECQETILNLGKQLKALSSPREPVMLDKVISIAPDTTTTTTTTTANDVKNKTMSRRASLLDQMLAEDDPEVQDLNSPKMKEIICTTDAQKPPCNPSEYLSSAHDSNGLSRSIKRSYSNETRYKTGSPAEMALAIVPSKKRGSGGGLFRKWLSRRKRGSSKMTLPMVA